MHPDLEKLLALQEKDLALQAVRDRLVAVREEVAALDQEVAAEEESLESARRAVADAVLRRTELEAKIELFRTQQERRRRALEMTHPGRDAANMMAELDLARSVLAQEESEWVRLADTVQALEQKVTETEGGVAELKAGQEPQRAELLSREEGVLSEEKAAEAECEKCAALLDKVLRIKYERLYRSRATRVVVPLAGPACGACHTTIPLHRRSQIKSGAVLGGCEACGVILYWADEEG